MTRPQDAAAAVGLGVDAVGLIFAPGAARRVSVEQAGEILNQTGPFVTAVAVFSDASAAGIFAVASELSIGTVQLHGAEPVGICQQLRPLRVIKAVRPNEADWPWIGHPRTGNFAGILVDAPGGGGAGVATDWDAVLGMKSKLDPFIAAGGLTPENVGDVIRRVRPYAVDVSSGIESCKGVKSVERMRAFVSAVRAVDAELSGV